MRGREARIQSVLQEYGALTRQALRRYLPVLEPRRYLYDLVADYPRRGGKMMRPSLCIATARTFGARAEEALRAAVSIELFHNSLLVHDDVHDESELRRGAPSLHVLHGVPLALNAGSTLGILSLRPLTDYRLGFGFKVPVLLVEEVVRMGRESAEGQALELGWRRDNVVDLCDADYFEMVLKKTCWYTTISPMRLGALIGCRDMLPEFDTLIRFG
ncbi:MAG TPA: polyprenyl synthetase family protein, partial [Thermoanaerobaculia bacterium]